MGIIITLRTRMFTADMSQRASEVYLDIQLRALVDMDLYWLRLNPGTPKLRVSGVRYYHEGIRDEWFDIGAALHEHVADCKGLAAWRVAELRASAEDVAAHTTLKFAVVDDATLGKMLLYHVQVMRGDGRIEDPSREQGMGGSEPDGYLPVPGVAWAVANALTHTVGAAMLGDRQGAAALEELWQRSQRGDRRARYLVGVVQSIVDRGYDPRRTEFVRQADGSFAWVYPGEGGTQAPPDIGLESRGGVQGGR
jgi:hypothetical protein